VQSHRPVVTPREDPARQDDHRADRHLAGFRSLPRLIQREQHNPVIVGLHGAYLHHRGTVSSPCRRGKRGFAESRKFSRLQVRLGEGASPAPSPTDQVVRPRGIEPLAFGFVVRRSIHLS
jgi:hypothetical protein